MIFFLFFTFCLLVSLSFLLHFFTWKTFGQRLLCLAGSLFYLALGMPLSLHVFTDMREDLLPKMALLSAGITVLFLRRKKAPRKASLGKSFLLHATALLVGFCLIGINAFENLSSEKPILRICITGVTEKRHTEWKNPQGPSMAASLEYHEVLLKRMDGTLLGRYLLPGDLVAIRAKTFRFHSLLGALGVSPKYRLDLIYSGYRRAEHYRTLPVEAWPLTDRTSLLNSFLFTSWEAFFCKTADSFWIKSARLESNYFPLSDEQGTPLDREFFLTLCPASFTSSANFRPAARRPSVAPFSSSIAPSAMDSSKVATSGASHLAEILPEEVNEALCPTGLSG